MSKDKKVHERESEVSRREFLQHATHLVVGGSALALIGCGSDEEEEAVDTVVPTKPDSTGTVTQQQPPQQEEPKEPPQEEPKEQPPGVEVKMGDALKGVGGSQKVENQNVLKELNTKDAILLVRVDEKTVAANTIICTHQGCEVGYNKGAKRLDCPCHGSRYDLNGKVIQGPAPRALKHFKATIQGDSVFLEKA